MGSEVMGSEVMGSEVMGSEVFSTGVGGARGRAVYDARSSTGAMVE